MLDTFREIPAGLFFREDGILGNDLGPHIDPVGRGRTELLRVMTTAFSIALWVPLIDPSVRGTFTIELGQALHQDAPIKGTGKSTSDHFTTPLRGATGLAAQAVGSAHGSATPSSW